MRFVRKPYLGQIPGAMTTGQFQRGAPIGLHAVAGLLSLRSLMPLNRPPGAACRPLGAVECSTASSERLCSKGRCSCRLACRGTLGGRLGMHRRVGWSHRSPFPGFLFSVNLPAETDGPSEWLFSIPPSRLSISCGKPIAGLFASELERHHRIPAPSAPGQFFEHILQTSRSPSTVSCPQLSRAAARWATCNGRPCCVGPAVNPRSFTGKPFFPRARSILPYRHTFSQLSFSEMSETDTRRLCPAAGSRMRRLNGISRAPAVATPLLPGRFGFGSRRGERNKPSTAAKCRISVLAVETPPSLSATPGGQRRLSEARSLHSKTYPATMWALVTLSSPRAGRTLRTGHVSGTGCAPGIAGGPARRAARATYARPVSEWPERAGNAVPGHFQRTDYGRRGSVAIASLIW
jgi:hypothetical protein